MANLIHNIELKASSASAPARKFADCIINTGADILEMQFASTRVYGEIGFRQLHKLAGVTSLDQAKEFAWSQIEPLSEVNKQLLNDWKGLVSINNGMKDELKSVFTREKPKTPAPKARAKRKPVARKTASAKSAAAKPTPVEAAPAPTPIKKPT